MRAMTTEITNASQFPQVFYAKHMQPGICAYENETILVDTDAVKAMMPSFVGRPIYIHHQNVDLATMKEKASGYVTESFYNELDGWAWVKVLAIDDEMHNAITKGWSVSNAYVPAGWSSAGTKNNCPYDREVTNANFTHLAIVPNPRYEDACIMSPDEFRIYQDGLKRQLAELQNSAPTIQKGSTMFKLWKSEKKPVTGVDADTMVEIQNADGKTTEISIAEMVNAVKKNADDEAAAKKKLEDEKDNSDQEVTVGEEKMPLKELVNRYQKMNEKKNADEAEEKKKKDEAEKANADAEAKKKEEEEKENAKGQARFDELRNANKTGNAPVETIDSSAAQMERGKARYGSAA